MARETLDLFIKVTDQNGAATFQRLGAAGKKATDEIAKGSKAGTTALKDMGREADRAAQAAQKLESGFTKAGVAIGTGIGALSKLGQASTEERRQIDGITRAYGEASAQVLAFAEQVQDSTTFSNDAAREAALAASSLASNYGLTADQIGALVSRSADLASVFGIDLVDATQRVAGAIRGEGEAAELLALNLSDSAVAAAAAAAGLTGWNTTMTEGEKAAFRYSLLMEQSAYATGAAGDAADTTAGQFKQFRNEVQDAAADLGTLAGPAAEAAAVLGDLALIAPVAGGVLGKLAGTAVTAAGAAGIGGLTAGIIGLTAAATAAVVPLAAVSAVVYQRGQERNEAFTEDFDVQTARLNELGLAADENAKKLFDWVRTSNQTGGMAAGQVQALNDSYDELLQLGGPYLQTLLFVAEGMDQETESAMVLGQMIEDLYQTQLVAQTALYGQGLALQYATSEQQAYTQSVEEAAAAEERAAIKRAGRDTSADPLGRPRAIGLEDPNADDMGLPDYNAAVARSTELQAQMAEVQGRVADGFGDIKAEMAATAAELSAANQEFIAYVASGENIIDVLQALDAVQQDVTATVNAGREGFALMLGERQLGDGLIRLGDWWLDIAENASTAEGALSSAFDTIIGGTERLGQVGQQVADWASELTGLTFDGTTFVQETDALNASFEEGKISAEEYNAAIQAGKDILWNNALIQADITAMQAQQAPLIAERTNAYQDQIAALAQLTPAEQRHALMMMDAGVQTQVANAYSTAYAASLGEIPEDVATEIILAEAAANPDIDALYRELKLIEEDPITGEVRVNFPDADSTTAVLADLNETLEDLVEIIAEVNGLTISPTVDPKVGAALAAFVKPTGNVGPGDGTGGGGPAASDTVGDGTGGPVGFSGERRVRVTMDYSAVETGAAEVEGILGGLADGDWTANLYADGKQASATIEDTRGQIVAVVEGDWIIPVNADGTQARGEAVQVEGALEAVVGGSYVATINGDGSLAHSAINAVNESLNYINGTSGVVYIYGDNSAALAAIGDVTGFVGTAVVNVVPNVIGGANFGFATGGTVNPDHGPYAPLVPSYATGGTHAMVGEHGPELVWLPNGAQVTNAAATESRLRGGRDGQGGITVYGNITINPPNQDVYGAIRSSIYQGGGW